MCDPVDHLPRNWSVFLFFRAAWLEAFHRLVVFWTAINFLVLLCFLCVISSYRLECNTGYNEKKNLWKIACSSCCGRLNKCYLQVLFPWSQMRLVLIECAVLSLSLTRCPFLFLVLIVPHLLYWLDK